MILCFSCSKDNKTKTDAELQGLRNNVLFVHEKSEGDLLSQELYYEFDETGKILRKIDYFKINGSTVWSDCSYNYTDGILTSQLVRREDGNNTEDVYSYNEDGKLLQIVGNNSLTKFRYTNGLLTEKSEVFTGEFDNVRKSLFFYDKAGKLDSTIITNMFLETIIKFIQHFDDSEREIQNYSYKSSNQDYDNLNLYNKKTFTYNSNNDLESEIENDYEENTTDKTEYQYTYDESGNWIKQITKDSDGISEIIREVYYTKEEYQNRALELESKLLASSNSSQQDTQYQNTESYSNSYSGSNSYDNSNSNNNSKRQCSYCSGSGKCKNCNKTFRVKYWGGSSGWISENQTRVGYVMCGWCYGSGKRYNAANIDQSPTYTECKVCNATGWELCNECNVSGRGTNLGQCSYCNGKGYK